MAGQEPYKPFENTRLKWKNARSEVGGAALAMKPQKDLTLGTPGLFLFLSSRDEASCCAANYERTIFRDRKVVKLASSHSFVTLRLDRTKQKPDVLKRFGVGQKAALVVTDNEGRVHAKWETCTDPKVVLKAMIGALKASKKKAKVAPKMLDRFEDAEKALGMDSYRAAGQILRKILRMKGGPAAGHERAQSMLDDMEERGRTLLGEAKALSDVTQRYDVLYHLRHEFWDFDGLVSEIKPLVKGLEEGEETRDAIHGHKGSMMVRDALALIEKGKDAKGRTLLRKVRKDFAGTPAGDKAAELLKK